MKIYKTVKQKLFQIPLKYRLVLPIFAVLIVILGYPLGYALWISLTDYNLANLGGASFIGLGNYLALAQSEGFIVSLGNTLFFVGVAVPLELFFGIIIALTLNKNVPFKNFFRSILLSPMFLAPVAVALMFRFMLNSEFGIISYFLNSMGLPSVAWFSEAPLAMLTIIAIDVWQWTPFVMIMVLAGLEALPDEPYEAAKIDGASGWQTFFRVTLPLVSPVLMIAVVIRMLDAFKVFAKVLAITQGGPGRSTETIGYFIYKVGFKFFRMGEGAAMGYTLLLIILGLVAVQFVVLRKARFKRG